MSLVEGNKYMNDALKIQALRSLLATVVNNTKSTKPNPSATKREEGHTKKVLQGLLGRDPSDNELKLAMVY